MKTPLVSIIIPTYNRLNVLSETLASIKAQTYTNWEAIVIDDGSSDGTKKYMAEHYNESDSIKFVLRTAYSKIKGASSCRNIGLNRAAGDYVIFLDSDDLLSHTCLQNRVESFNTHPDLNFLVFSGAFFAENIEDSNRLWNKFTQEDDLLRFLRGDVVWQTSGPIWKKSFLLDHKHCYDVEAKSSQDWEFHVHILLQTPKYVTVASQPDYFVRRDLQDKNRISDGHYSSTKYMNRSPLITKIVHKLVLKIQYRALHKYVVRDTVACLKSETDVEILKEFKKVNALFPNPIRKRWWFVIKLIYLSLKNNSKLLYRVLIKCIDICRPGYYKEFKLNYKSRY